MKSLTLSSIVLCALGLETALAMPSIHNVHRHMHKKKDVDWNNPDLYTGVDWKKVDYSQTSAASSVTTPAVTTSAAAPAVKAPSSSAAPPPPPSSSSAAAPSATPSSSSSSSSGGCGTTDSDGFCTQGFGGQTTPVNNGNVDQYKGNCGSPYGSNIQTVSSNIADKYKYTVQFVSTASSSINVIIWNKSGPDGQPNSGQYSAPSVSFPLAAGATQFVAFDENTQTAFCHDTGKKTQYGAYDCTFGEADFGNLSNNKWSGADVSSIQNTAGNNMPMDIQCGGGQSSSNNGNNYVSDAQPGGIGCNLAPGKVRLTVKLG